jgi:membrane-associated phospholipid phosphatase
MSGSWWKTEILSGAYTSYLIYLHWALIGWLIGPLEDARRFWTFLFVTYSVGFLGYLLVPAIGPGKAFPEIFVEPVVGSGQGLLSQFNSFVAQGSSVYDVFPSLHVLITLVLLDFDRRCRPWRFYLMIPVCGLIFFSTIYLRYHYFVDLMSGALLFQGLRLGFDRWLFWEAANSSRRRTDLLGPVPLNEPTEHVA